jgi:hypothetical protein
VIRLPEHIAAVLIHAAASSSGKRLSFFEADLNEKLSQLYSIEAPGALIKDALAVLKEIGGAKDLTSPLTGTYWTITANSAEYYFGSFPSFTDYRGDDDIAAQEDYEDRRHVIAQKYPVIDTYFQADEMWIGKVVEILSDLDITQQYYLDGHVPEPLATADLINTETVEAIDEVRDGLEALQRELETNNEAGAIFGEEKTAAIAEVSALRVVVQSDQIRASTVIAHARRALTWIAEKASGAAVGDLAKRMLDLIIGMFT